MNTLLYILLGLAVLGVVYALTRGVLLMASGKDITGEQSNRMMSMRVKLQAAAIIIVVLIFLLSQR
jgi:hypothetical protein